MVKEQTREKIIDFFPKQFQAYNFVTQFGAAICGSQGGKTFVGSHWSGKKIQEFPKDNGSILAPTYKILQQATMEKFFQEFPSLRRCYKEQKGIIELPTGGKVFVRSADRPLGVEGMTIHWWWFDEAGMAPRLSFTVLRTRVSVTGGQGFITTTPHNMGWLYSEYYQLAKYLNGEELRGGYRDPGYSVFNWKSIDNPYFPRDHYDAEKRRLTPEEFGRRYEGLFKKMEGLVYDLPEKQIIEPAQEEIKKKATARIMAIDWGFVNPAGIGVYYLYDNVWYIADEWKKTGKTTAEIIEVAIKMKQEHQVGFIYPDPAEPDRLEEMKRAGLEPEECNKDVKGGISFVQQLIRESQFYIFKNCHEHIDEINTYHYPEEKEGRPIKDEPAKINDHLMDCMRYAIFNYPRDTIFTMPGPTPSIKPFYPELGH